MQSVRLRSAALLRLALLLWATVLVMTPTSGQTQVVDKRPNIVLIMADDLRADDLPQLSRINSLLVQRGANFTQFFTPNALCCPSRMSVLRGQFSHNHDIWTNFTETGGGFVAALEKGLLEETIAVWLQRGGYQTGLFGKFLNGYGKPYLRVPTTNYIPPGWSRWFGALTEPGDYYSGYNYTVNDDGVIRNYGATPADYLTDVLAAQAKSFIITSRQDQPRQPLFLYIAPTAPHRNIPPAVRHQPNIFENFVAARPSNFNEVDLSDKPAWMQAIAPMTNKEIAGVSVEIRRRLGSMLAVEDLVEDVLYALDQIGELENSYIFFMSDNGIHFGEHRLQSKATVYDASVRVPLVVRGPGVDQNQPLAHMIYNHDLPATFAAIAGVATPDFLDGKSVLPLLASATRPRSADWRQAVLLEHRENKGGPRKKDDFASGPTGGSVQPEVFAIRTTDWHYSDYADRTIRCELYRLGRLQDPFMLTNLCDLRAYATVQSQLRTRVRELSSCAAATCRMLEMLPLAAPVPGSP